MSALADRVAATLALYPGLPFPVRELRFHPKRRWRFDFAWPDTKLALEVEGGTFIAGRHARGGGFSRDCEKYNAAVLLGWRVLRYDAPAIRAQRYLPDLIHAIGASSP